MRLSLHRDYELSNHFALWITFSQTPKIDYSNWQPQPQLHIALPDCLYMFTLTATVKLKTHSYQRVEKLFLRNIRQNLHDLFMQIFAFDAEQVYIINVHEDVIKF